MPDTEHIECCIDRRDGGEAIALDFCIPQRDLISRGTFRGRSPPRPSLKTYNIAPGTQGAKGGECNGNAIRTEVQRSEWGKSGTARLAGPARAPADRPRRRGGGYLARRSQEAYNPPAP